MDSRLEQELIIINQKLDYLIDVVYKSECAEYERKKKECDNKINSILLKAAQKKRQAKQAEQQQKDADHKRYMDKLNGSMSKYKKGGTV